MKINKITALVLTALAVTQFAGFAAHAATQQLTVWEDIKKSAGIKEAIADFENSIRLRSMCWKCLTHNKLKTPP